MLDKQGIRLGIQYYINGGWCIVADAPYLQADDATKLQDVIDAHCLRHDREQCDAWGDVRGTSHEFIGSSSPYTHTVQLYWISNPPRYIELFMKALYETILQDAHFYSPEMPC